jgi:hypothetical protein
MLEFRMQALGEFLRLLRMPLATSPAAAAKHFLGPPFGDFDPPLSNRPTAQWQWIAERPAWAKNEWCRANDRRGRAPEWPPPIIGRHLSPMIHLQNQASTGAQTLIDPEDQTKNPKNRALPSTASSKPTRTRRQLGLIGGASFSGYGKYSKNRVQNELSTR